MIVKQALQLVETLTTEESELQRFLNVEAKQGRANSRAVKALTAELQAVRDERFALLNMTVTDEEEICEEG